MNKDSFKLFNMIAPIYAKFFNFQIKYFKETIEKAKDTIDITEFKTVLDVGCGTGALSYVLYKNGLRVTGVDPADRMVNIAKDKLKDTNIKIHKIDPEKEFPFSDKSFDIVISSYVVHGLKSKERLELYKEVSRLAKDKVIFHDYNNKRALLTTIIEWLEGGDYFNFIKVAEIEMKKHFKEVKIIDVYKRAAWYILTPYDE